MGTRLSRCSTAAPAGGWSGTCARYPKNTGGRSRSSRAPPTRTTARRSNRLKEFSHPSSRTRGCAAPFTRKRRWDSDDGSNAVFAESTMAEVARHESRVNERESRRLDRRQEHFVVKGGRDRVVRTSIHGTDKRLWAL